MKWEREGRGGEGSEVGEGGEGRGGEGGEGRGGKGKGGGEEPLVLHLFNSAFSGPGANTAHCQLHGGVPERHLWQDLK